MAHGRLARCRSAAHKIGWGLRVVGPSAALIGAVRYAGIRIRRPSSAILPIRSGGALEVGVPGQLITTLAVFGDLIDPEYDFLRRAMPPGAAVVDVGAGIGQFSVFAARNGAGVVHSVEPDEENLVVLRRNVLRNGIDDRVVTHRMAFSDCTGTGSLVAPQGVVAPRFNGRVVPGSVVGPGVEVGRLDAWAGRVGLGRIDVLKVNVAGDEASVLAGGRTMFEQGRVDLLVVLIGAGMLGALEELGALGYRWFLHRPGDGGAGTLFECHRFDRAFLARRPYPARHVLGASEPAVAGGLLDAFGLVTQW